MPESKTSRRDVLRIAGAGAATISLAGLLRADRASAAQPAGQHVVVDFAKEIGRIKPLQGVNNGPMGRGGTVDLSLFFREIGVTHVRLHDVHWPGCNVADVPAVFPLFHLDPDDPANYLFARTDDYIKAIVNVGAQITYRLGTSIEHKGHYDTHPPKDFAKWAKICVNIIRHYNEGWANGFHHNIRYWEIWNEPNIGKAMWSGTREQYFELYETAARAIKAGVPTVKVGGPALANPESPWARPFLQFCRDRQVPLDFFSWHLYRADPSAIRKAADLARGLMDEFGFDAAESHFNEWHYRVPGQVRPADPRKYYTARDLFETMNGPQGAAFAAAVLMILQDCRVDVANYYTGNTMRWGLFDDFGVPNKTYFAFRAFNELCKTPRRVGCTTAAPADHLPLCAGLAEDRTTAHFLASNAGSTDAVLNADLQNLPWTTAIRAETYRVDERSDFALASTASLDPKQPALTLDLPKSTVCLVRLSRA